MVNGGLTEHVKPLNGTKQHWQPGRRARRGCPRPGTIYASLNEMRQTFGSRSFSVGKNALAGTARTASASQYGL